MLLRQIYGFCINTARNFSSRNLPVLTLFTKDPCPLCDKAKADISVYANQFQMQTVDITEEGNENWWEKYKYDIPVFHFEGKFLMKHKADLPALKKALEQYNSEHN